MLFTRLTILSTGLASVVAAGAPLTVDPNNPQDVYQVARLLADQLRTYYDGDKPGKPAGIFHDHPWWVSSAAFDSLVEYTARSGDTSFSDIIGSAISNQAGTMGYDDLAFQPKNQSATLDNEDIASWALTSMSAAERGIETPGVSGFFYDKLADSAFQALAKRWDSGVCAGGGLRAAISDTDKKNYPLLTAGAMGNMFQLAARLYRYTNTELYGQWADKIYQYAAENGIIGPLKEVYYSADASQKCSAQSTDKRRYTADAASFFYGIGVMMAMTESNQHNKNIGTYLEWRARFVGHGMGVQAFRANDTSAIHEIVCDQSQQQCDKDVFALKGIALNWFFGGESAVTNSLPQLKSAFQYSAVKAAASCGSTATGHSCSGDWSKGWFGDDGLPAVIAALDAVLSIMDSPLPGTKYGTDSTPRTRNGKVFVSPAQTWPKLFA